MTRNFDSSSEFEALFEGAPKLYLVVNLDFKIVAASDAFCVSTYCIPEEILGRGIFEVFPDNPDDATASGVANLQASFERVLRHKHADALGLQRYDVLRPDRLEGGFEERYWRQLNTPVLDKDDHVLWIIHRVEDVTATATFGTYDSPTKAFLRVKNESEDTPSELDRPRKSREELLARLEQKLVARSIELQTEILERKKAEAILRRENTFHNILLDHIPAMVFVKDATDLCFVLINKTGEELLGIDRSEYIGKSDYDFFPREQADFFASRDRDVLLSGKLQVTEEEPIDTRQKGRRLLRTLKMAVPDDEGRPRYLLALSEDITERKMAESVLLESEARHRFLDALGKETVSCNDPTEVLSITTRMLGQHLNVAICAYADMEPDQDHFNIRGDWSAEGSASIVGYYSLASFGRLAVKNLGAGLPLIVNDNLLELAAEEAATFQGIGISATICMPLIKSGRLTALMAIHDRKPRLWNAYELSLLSEVTERSWAHIERVRSEVSVREGAKQLVQAQKMEAIGNLTGGVAHDFNNLLGIIIGNLDLLRGQSNDVEPLDPKVDELASEALDAALRGADLTKRLLAFARRQSLRPQQIDVNELVGDIARLLSRTLGDDIEIVLNLGSDIWSVAVDPSQLGASLMNIGNNARDAMPRGGILTISTGNRILDAEYAALNSEVAPGDYASIEISDTGTGIPSDILSQIFEPFFTTKERDKGTGLGLSMVFGFMKQSAGHVTVYSEEGHGTTFRLYLPRSKSIDSVKEVSVVSERGGNETILAVEDNERLRRVVVRQLNDLGYHVFEAANGAAALKILESEHIDLVFTDIMMPGGMSGFDLAQIALNRWSKLKVVLTSGFPETKLGGNGNSTDQIQILVKPYRKENLAMALRNALDGN